jgi:hypothetical protein
MAETPSDKSINPIVSNLPLSHRGEGVKCTSDTETVTEVNVELSHQIPIVLSEPETVPTEPMAQSVPPIAPPELVAEQKPERKTDDQVVAEKKHHKDFTEGDRVVITEVGNLHHGQKGEVIYVGYGVRDTDYKIKLDKTSHNQEVITIAVPKVTRTPLLMQLKTEGGAPG